MNKVLIAEDNPANLELLREILELRRYQIVEARDGREALARIVEANPDLVLLDINMPVLDGYAVVRCIRQDPRYSHLPVSKVNLNAAGVAVRVDERQRIGIRFTSMNEAGQNGLRELVEGVAVAS